MKHTPYFRLPILAGMLWLAAMTPALSAPGPQLANLRCEYLTNPIGIDTTCPRLSWEIRSSIRDQRQTAFQVLVATSPDRLVEGKADLWDTGKISSDQSIQFPYEGKTLVSRQRAWWTVRIWDTDGNASKWAEPAFWEMGLLAAREWQANWITGSDESTTLSGPDRKYHPAPLLRRTILLKAKPLRARAYVSGLGYCDLSINGKRVGDHLLDPAYTRFDTRSLYVTHDITGLLRKGQNAIGAMLGTGWYDVHTLAVWDFERAPWRGAPRLLLQLEVEYPDKSHETFVTDDSWKTSTGPVIFDSIYEGETYDARLEIRGWNTAAFDDKEWKTARVVDAPTSRILAQQMPPIRAMGRIKPVRITEPKPGVFLLDLGQNMSGVPEITVSGTAGTSISMTCGEQVGPDGMLDLRDINVYVVQRDPKQRFQTDTYILKGNGTETWHPQFTYHGFQYVQVTGFPGKPTLSNFAGIVMHTDLERVGEFECSNPLFNKLLEAARWSYLGNFFGIPTDCPQREKNGWTGDAHLAVDFALTNYFGPAAYTKWLDDIADAQRQEGDLPGIVPSGSWGYGKDIGPAWDSVYFIVPWALYRYHGDVRILTTHYEGMRRYVDYLTTNSEKHLVTFGLGDWAPWKTQTSNTLTSTGYYYADTLILARVASLLGKTEDARKYSGMAEEIRKAWNREFVNAETGMISSGSQTAQACAIYQGLTDEPLHEKIIERLVKKIEESNWHLDFGILGSKYVHNVLTEHGRADVAYRMANQRTQPSWGWWIEQGATTLWEQWSGKDSRNHIMFGDIVAWFTRALAGIDQEPDSVAFKHIVIRPYTVGDLTQARAAHRCPYGLIRSEWHRKDNRLTLKVTIPPNTTARVVIPAGGDTLITESGNAVQAERTDSSATVRVGSGDYEFVVTPK